MEYDENNTTLPSYLKLRNQESYKIPDKPTLIASSGTSHPTKYRKMVKRQETQSTGFKSFPAKTDDCGRLIKLLDSKHMVFFTYTVQSERDLNVVLRGLLRGIESKDIAEDLMDKGFYPTSVKRMTKGPENFPIP